MARPTNTAQRRREITAGLADVMAEHGYDGASVADVARAARLTPGLVHYHFQNKLEILLALLAELAEAHLQGLDRALAAAADRAGEQLDAYIDFHLAVGKSADPKRLACWIAIGAEAIREPKVRAPYRAVLEQLRARLEGIVRTGVTAKLFRSNDPAAAAVAILAVIQGYFGIAGTARDLIPAHSAAPQVKAMARALLASPPSTKKRVQ